MTASPDFASQQFNSHGLLGYSANSSKPLLPTTQAPDEPADSPQTPASIFITSRRLWYRALIAEDAPLIMALWNDPRVRRTTRARFPVSSKDVSTQNSWQRGMVNDHSSFVFGNHGTQIPIGTAAIFDIDWIGRNAEFGIMIEPNHWNHGYGREVAYRLLHYGFGKLNLHRVELQVLATNHGGFKAYQAAGFLLEGTRRQAVLIEGRWEDIHLMAALHDNWQAPATFASTQ